MRLLSTLLALLLLTGGFAQSPPARANQQETRQLARLSKEHMAAKVAYLKKPSDAALKKRYVVATVRLGTATMTSLSIPSKVRYPSALRLYREALKLDPKNHEARNNSQMIIGIYKQLGRPVPKG